MNELYILSNIYVLAVKVHGVIGHHLFKGLECLIYSLIRKIVQK